MVNSEADVQLLHLLVVGQHLDGGIVFTFLDRQQQIAVLYFHTLQGMTLTQYEWFLLSVSISSAEQHCHQRKK